MTNEERDALIIATAKAVQHILRTVRSSDMSEIINSMRESEPQAYRDYIKLKEIIQQNETKAT